MLFRLICYIYFRYFSVVMQINLLFEVCYGIECGKDDESRLFYAPRNENYNDLLTFKNFLSHIHVVARSMFVYHHYCSFLIVSSWELSSFQGLSTITHEPLLKWQEWGEGRDLRFKILIISKEFWAVSVYNESRDDVQFGNLISHKDSYC